MNAVAIGPSLVDLSARLEPASYESCLELLQVNPGDWKRLSTIEDLNLLTSILLGEFAVASWVHQPPGNVEITAGSTVLGMLAALEPENRLKSTIVTATAVSADSKPDELSVFFTECAEAMGVRHDALPRQGVNPLGFVICSDSNPEKILVNYPGVATELDDYDLSRHTDPLVIVDAYELLGGKLAKYLDEIIMGGKYKVALSLGNTAILQGDLVERIREYVDKQKLHILCGNQDEYQLLYPGQAKAATKKDFDQHPVALNVPYSLITFGPQGLATSWDGRHAETEAYHLDDSEIVNTSGAGDTSAGGFISGVMNNSSPVEVLERAARLSTNTLRTSASLTVARY